MATESNKDGAAQVIGEPTGTGLSGPPEFDTDKIVDWTCPSCGENGSDSHRTADYYPLCTNLDCRVSMFSVFRDLDSESD